MWFVKRFNRTRCAQVFAVTGALVGLQPSQLLAADFTWLPLDEPGSGGQITSVSVSPFDADRVLMGGDLLGIGVSTNGGDSWGQTFGLTGGGQSVEQFTWSSSSTVWAGTAKGPYRSTDGGKNWTLKRSGFPSFAGSGLTAPVQKILIDPSFNARHLAFIGSFRRIGGSYTNLGQVWESTNSGDTWALKSTIASGKHIEHAVYKDNSTIYAIAGGKFYRSGNDGGSWSQEGTGLPSGAKWVTKSPTSNSTVWVATSSNGVWRSDNSGDSFTKTSSGLSSGGSGRAVVEVDQDTSDGRNTLYYIYSKGTYRSNNGGSSWSEAVNNKLGGSAYLNNIVEKIGAFDPSDSDRFFFGNNNSLWRTENNASSWTVTTSEALGDGFYVGTGYSGLVAEDFFFNPFNPNESATAALDTGRWFSSDNLQSWKFSKGGVGSGPDRFYGTRVVAFTNTSGSSQVIYMDQGQFGSNTKLYRTTNGGTSWSSRSLPSGSSGNIQDLYAHPTSTNTVWLIRSSNLYKSTTGGGGWTELTSGLSGNIRTITADPVNAPNTIYAGGDNGVFKSTNGGSDFTSLNFPRNGATDILIDPVKLDRIYVVNGRDSNRARRGVYRYNGDTGTWSTIVRDGNSSLKSIADVAIDPLDNTRVFVSTDQDPFKSNTNETGVWLKEGSGSFAKVNDGLRNLRVQSLTFKPGTSTLIAGTNGSGYYRANTGSGGGGGGLNIQVAGAGRTVSGFTGYSNQDLSGGLAIQDGGSTIRLTGNSWKKVPLAYNVTANTVLKFDFLSTDQGEIHGIALDSNNDPSDTKRAFQVHGTQTWTQGAFTSFNNYSGSSYRSYTIPVGDFFTGSVSNLVFINDGDSNTGNSSFRNIELLENGSGGGTTLASSNFNSTSNGSIPSAWIRDTGAGSVGVVEFPSASNKSLRIVDTKASDNSSAQRTFTASTGVITAEFRFRQSDQDNWTRLQLRNGGVIAVDLRTNGGNIAIQGASSTTNLRNFNSGTWYDIKIVADTNSDRFDVFINGVSEATNVAFRNTVSQLSRFYAGPGTSGKTTVWIDDLLVTK